MDRVCTEFLAINNDYIEVYAYEENGKIIITDEGDTMFDLTTSIDENIHKHKGFKAACAMAKKNSGIKLKKDAFVVEAKPEEYWGKKCAFIAFLVFLYSQFGNKVFKEAS